MLIALLNFLIIGVGLTAAVDLRRLQTPGGTALRWAQAAVFGDCADYLTFSVADASVPDTRSSDQLCKDLRATTAQARGESLRIGLHLKSVEVRGSRALVQLVLTRSEVPTPVSLDLARVNGDWRVVRDTLTCSSLGCA